MKNDFNFKRFNDLWTVQAPAKINLVLEILDQRPDGFHEIFTIVSRIDLSDELIFQRKLPKSLKSSEKGELFELFCQTENGVPLLELPNDKRNLVFRAAELLLTEAHQKQVALTGPQKSDELSGELSQIFPLTITLKKKIPSEAGLGGGSSDAAATLYALNRIWNLQFSSEHLQELGARLGSDVPLFFEPGLVICQGRGEICRSAGPAPNLNFALLKPNFGLATAKVYSQWKNFKCNKKSLAVENVNKDQICDSNNSVNENKNQICENNNSVNENKNQINDNINIGPMKKEEKIEKFFPCGSDSSENFARWFNHLEKPAFALRPDLADMKKQIEKLSGVQKVQMTGSGTALFALCENREMAQACCDFINRAKWGQGFIVRTIN